MRHSFPIFLLLSLGVAACDSKDEDTGPEEADTDTDTDADTDTDTDADTDTDPVILTLNYSYTDSEWWYELTAEGGPDLASLDIYQYEGGFTWEEYHELQNTSGGTWEATLEIVSDIDDQTSGVSTLFQGNTAREATLTWMYAVYSSSGVADCVVTGKFPEYYGSYGCAEISF